MADWFIPCLYDEWEEYNIRDDMLMVRCEVKECFAVYGMDRSERVALTLDSRVLLIDDEASPLRVLNRDTLFRALYGEGFTHG